jgi:hypothetical protein
LRWRDFRVFRPFSALREGASPATLALAQEEERMKTQGCVWAFDPGKGRIGEAAP